MSTTRTLARRVTRRFEYAVAPLTYKLSTARPSNVRFSSTTATPEKDSSNSEVNAAMAKELAFEVRKLTLELDKLYFSQPSVNHEFPEVSGEVNAPTARELVSDVRKLTFELDRLFSSQRLSRRLEERPYKVNPSHDPAALDEVHDVEIQDDKVTVSGRPLPNIWLRDNCQCSSCVHDATKQRLLDTFSIPKDIAIKRVSLDGDVLNIEWSDGHKSEYARKFLAQTGRSSSTRAIIRQGLLHMQLWGSNIAKNPPVVKFRPIRTNLILSEIRKYGFCYVDGVPFDTPKATKTLLQHIAFIRETHYGGFYDFTADLSSKDTAYTNIALEAHTDTTYFSDPAGLQAFHLLSHPDGEGGASLLVDGFKVAQELLETDPEAYDVLSTVNVHAHASGNEGISIQPYRSFPVLEHDDATGQLLRVRWNSADRAAIDLPVDQVEKWYDAARKFDALLKKKENEYWEQLTPGRVLIFDNWRVLHGRSAFTGKRRICGGYINRDDWISKHKMTTFGKDTVLGALAAS